MDGIPAARWAGAAKGDTMAARSFGMTEECGGAKSFRGKPNKPFPPKSSLWQSPACGGDLEYQFWRRMALPRTPAADLAEASMC